MKNKKQKRDLTNNYLRKIMRENPHFCASEAFEWLMLGIGLKKRDRKLGIWGSK
jgi:hypothetical protein